MRQASEKGLTGGRILFGRMRGAFVCIAAIGLLAAVLLAQPVRAESDFGDAPDAYQTRSEYGGAEHPILAGYHMGLLIDAELDGQPDAAATGDNLHGENDEDGVTFLTPIIAGNEVRVEVVASGNGYIDAWIDYARDGTWAQVEDRIFDSVPVMAGPNTLIFRVPSVMSVYIDPGTTYTRFRFSSTGGLAWWGVATDGEVEDYAAPLLVHEDFGDAPSSYGTRLAGNGASHYIVGETRLGATIDEERDGQPDADARGDDVVGMDDEDGVTFLTPLAAGNDAQVRVEASTNGYLFAWIDYGRDGSWAEGEDQVLDAVPLFSGTNVVRFAVPSPAEAFVKDGKTYARFRFSTTNSLPYWGPAPDGEVEDYAVQMEVRQDFGDAPDTYGTTAWKDGAQHLVKTGYFLGQVIDWEEDGQPGAGAQGDDLVNTDDEDGVTFLTPLAAGNAARVEVVASTNGYFSLWADLGGDGGWWETADALLHNVPVQPGANVLSFRVPAPSEAEMQAGSSYARARFTSTNEIAHWGYAPDGEVEDYEVEIVVQQDFGDAPDWYGTYWWDNGAVHTIVTGYSLGNAIDGEDNGQPSADASGDDDAGVDDEDGVRFLTPLTAGEEAAVELMVSTNGFVNAWIDFGINGGWGEAEDRILAAAAVSNGVNVFRFVVPQSVPAATSSTYARFRFGSAADVGPVGPALDGEVEDYVVVVGTPLRVRRAARETGDYVNLSWQDVGLSYTVRYSTNLMHDGWAPAEGTDWPVYVNAWTSTVPVTNAVLFYRVEGN